MSMPKRYEKVECGKTIEGNIVEIQEEPEHVFKRTDKTTQEKKEWVSEAIRFVFEFPEYNDKKFSRWMYFSYAEKYDLYKKYLVALVENPTEEMLFDIQDLVNMPVKTIWKEENGFQSIDTIMPGGAKATIPEVKTPDTSKDGKIEETDVPF